MLYHCGLLDEQPDKSRTLNWIKRPHWGTMPPDIERELSIFLAMPGLTTAYVSHLLRHSDVYVKRRMGFYEDWKAEVDANWASATCCATVGLRSATTSVDTRIGKRTSMRTGHRPHPRIALR